MNSYPAELLVQLAPVMFVAGLDLPPPSTSSPNSPQSPRQAQSPPPTPTKHDPFQSLIVRLRDVLQSQRKVAIWAPERARTFQMILVGRDVRFPPRKLVSPDDPAYATTHSPLSPLTPSSPLYPDGLIAPIWIRKHTALLPSVFVLFLRLFETPLVHPRSPLDPPDLDHEREKAEEERRRDTELSAEVAARKKMTSERGIKLTVVLLASRRMLDDSSLDTRLTFIRRQSGLDSRAALFVLSPVSTSELNDFARSLQDALYEPALEYYTSHSKRVRRKRNRHSQTVSSYNPPMGAVSARPLRPEGWTVRYEYKMACFAEFRGEDEVALKHYQDAYATLMIMFGSTAILPPRTKRWAEAKVLADAINVKINKLYLYNSEHSLALSHHNSHMRRFADFSRGWGIGEETFEYWSWMARQHRVLAELLEQGSLSSLTFPTNSPPSRATGISPASTPVELDSARTLGLNPSHALQHPGHYYYMAARCTELRRERFLASEGTSQGVSAAPGYANERKVDHLSLTLELYTKSYEVFKKYSSTTSQGRLTLWIAYRIARTYYESEKFDVAIRFFERIAKTYRREKWKNMLSPLLSIWYACAQKLGDVGLMVTLLVEMIGYARDTEESKALQEDLLAVLESSVPVSGEPLVVDLKESESLLDTLLVFWTPEVHVGEEAAFQLSLAAPANIDLSALPVVSVIITFSGGYHPVVLRHSFSMGDEVASDEIDVVKIGKVVRDDVHDEPEKIEANLRWGPGKRLVVSGTISSVSPGSLTIASINVILARNEWVIEMPHALGVSHETSTLVPRWLTSVHPARFMQLGRNDMSSVVIRHRPHELAISFSHQEPAILDEEYPIVINVTNIDERHLDVVVDVLLQPTEVDEASQSIIFDDQRSSGLIKGIQFGTIAPGVSAIKTLHLVGSGAPGDRMIDISIQSTSVQAASVTNANSTAKRPRSSSSTSTHPTVDACEKLQTILIPISKALSVTYNIVYRRSKNAMPALADLSTVEDDVWDDSCGGVAIVAARIECNAPCGLMIESLKLHRHDNPLAKVLDSSLDKGNDIFIDEYLPGDELCDVSRISLSPQDEQVLAEETIPSPGDYEVVWRRMIPGGAHGRQSITRFALPTLVLPRDGLIALLDVPSTAKLHVPAPIQLTVRNRHPFCSANVAIILEPDPSDGFIVAGLRNGRLPILLPGSEEKLLWNLIPIECGHVKVPRIKVVDVRHAPPPSQGTGVPSTEVEVEGKLVRVVDVHSDWKTGSAQNVGENVAITRRGGVSTILVLP